MIFTAPKSSQFGSNVLSVNSSRRKPESERALAVGLEASRRTSARATALLSPELAREIGLGLE